MYKKSYIYLAFIYAFFYIPIFVVIGYSFNNSNYSLIWHGFTMQWYKQLFQDAALWLTVWHSLVIGTLAATSATLVGSLAAISLYRYHFFAKNLLYLITFILIISPDIVLGTALLVLYNFLHITLGFLSLLIAHITFCIPFVIVISYGRLLTFDRYLFEAAKDLGATDGVIFLKIIFPLLFPATIAAWLLSFTLSLDDVIISYFVSGPSYQILPLQIYSMVRVGVNPEINALSTIIFVFTLGLVFCASRFLRKTL